VLIVGSMDKSPRHTRSRIGISVAVGRARMHHGLQAFTLSKSRVFGVQYLFYSSYKLSRDKAKFESLLALAGTSYDIVLHADYKIFHFSVIFLHRFLSLLAGAAFL